MIDFQCLKQLSTIVKLITLDRTLLKLSRRKRANRAVQKYNGVSSTCSKTKAFYLELVSDILTERIQLMFFSKIQSQDEDGEPMYQNQKVQFYSREKRLIEDHIVQIVERVVSCFEKRYGNLYSNIEETCINIPSDNGDRIILDIYRILSCNV